MGGFGVSLPKVPLDGMRPVRSSATDFWRSLLEILFYQHRACLARAYRPQHKSIFPFAIETADPYLHAMPMPPLPDLASLSLAEIARLVDEKKLPPVEQWNPEHCGDSEMRIARDGTWFHQGSPIGREAMVRLFATILRREADGSYVLVTPVEKLTIEVEDAPFVAVEVNAQKMGKSRSLTFRLNTGEIVTANEAHPIEIRPGEESSRPYLHVRGGLDALIARSVYYELVNLALADDDVQEKPGLWSNGAFFALGVPA